MNTITDITNIQELIYLWLSPKSPTTVETYSYTIKQFLQFVGKDLADLKLEDLVLWRQRLQLTYAPISVNNKLRHLKSLLSFAHQIGYLDQNLGSFLQLKPEKNRISEKILTREDLQKLIDGALLLRDRLLLKLMYSCGLRVSEAICLQWRDFRANKLTVFGKGGKTRTVIIPSLLLSQLQQLKSSSSFVFVSRHGKPLNRSMVHKMLKRTALRVGLNPELSSHWLRHSHATHALESGCNIRLLQQSLGHSKISTTELYLGINPEHGSSEYIKID